MKEQIKMWIVMISIALVIFIGGVILGGKVGMVTGYKVGMDAGYKEGQIDAMNGLWEYERDTDAYRKINE